MNCNICTQPFTPKTPNQKYCCNECSYVAQQQQWLDKSAKKNGAKARKLQPPTVKTEYNHKDGLARYIELASEYHGERKIEES